MPLSYVDVSILNAELFAEPPRFPGIHGALGHRFAKPRLLPGQRLGRRPSALGQLRRLKFRWLRGLFLNLKHLG